MTRLGRMAIKARLKSQVLQSRRKTVYRMLMKRHGFVPCFVCGEHVDASTATAEHIIPLSRGGTDDIDNIAISHRKCNMRRSDSMEVGNIAFSLSRGFKQIQEVVCVRHTKANAL